MRSPPTSWPPVRRTAARACWPGRAVNVEFISANPTGPLHLGHTRWAVLGDAIAPGDRRGRGRGDAGVLHQRPRQPDEPVRGLARGRTPWACRCPRTATTAPTSASSAGGWWSRTPASPACPRGSGWSPSARPATRCSSQEQKDQLAGIRTHFDVWFSERHLHDSGKVEHALEVLEKQGHLFEADGALWMRTTDFGDDSDRVLRRGNGELTYFASDTAYYVDKRERGFDVCIYLLGADHHGYVGRLKAMAACAGDDPSRNIEVPIGQLVKILRDGEELRLSKRAGTIVTLEELAELIGVDAAALLAGPLPGRLAAGARRRRDHPVLGRQPGLLRAVRPRAHLPDDAQRRRPRHVPARGLRPGAAHPREGGRPAAGTGRVPPGGRRRRRAASSRTGSRATSRTPPPPSTGSTTAAGCCPRATSRSTRSTRPGCCSSVATRTVLANGLDLLGVSAPERM